MINSIQASSTAVASQALPAAAADKAPVAAPSVAKSVEQAEAKTTQQVTAALKDPGKLQQQLSDAIEQLNRQMKNTQRDLGFSMDNRLNWQVVTVHNTNTGEVVRQIPTEDVLRVAHNIEDLRGLLHDTLS